MTLAHLRFTVDTVVVRLVLRYPVALAEILEAHLRYYFFHEPENEFLRNFCFIDSRSMDPSNQSCDIRSVSLRL